MALLCGIDFETTGLCPKTDKVIEVGMALWDTRDGLIECESFLLNWEDLAVPITPEITALTGLRPEVVKEWGKTHSFEGRKIAEYFRLADYTVAHNAPFEEGFLRAWPGLDGLADMNPWIDTKEHIPGHEGKRLTYLAADHGILNPFPHRALPDVLTMLTVLAKYDFREVERRALAPKQVIRIGFPYDPTGEKNKAVKALGFGWNPDLKVWTRTAPDFEAQNVIQKAVEAGFSPQLLVPDEILAPVV